MVHTGHIQATHMQKRVCECVCVCNAAECAKQMCDRRVWEKENADMVLVVACDDNDKSKSTSTSQSHSLSLLQSAAQLAAAMRHLKKQSCALI